MIGYKDLPKYIDISAVRTDVTYEEVRELARLGKKFGFICVITMPSYTKSLVEYMKGSGILTSGCAGFPSGTECTDDKVNEAKRMVEIGTDEIDMVMNVGAMLSEDYDLVYSDIKAVVDAVAPVPVKAIIEISYLTDNQIRKACEIAVDAGVEFVKTGTGWASKPTTVETIKTMKAVIGNRAKIKAAGGIRTLATLEEMVDAGCDRFGISAKSALKILKEAYDREGIPFDEPI